MPSASRAAHLRNWQVLGEIVDAVGHGIKEEFDLIADCFQYACVATLTIRNVPDALHKTLKRRAKQNRRSLNQQVIAELSLGTSIETAEERHARVECEILEIQALRGRAKGFLTAKEIDKAKRDGRA